MRIHLVASYIMSTIILFVVACTNVVTYEQTEPTCQETPSSTHDAVPCRDIYDCPRDCNWYTCNDGMCTSNNTKTDGLPCSLQCTDQPAFCRAGTCTPGCEYSLDCPRPNDCQAVTCANNECSYDPMSNVPCDNNGTCINGVCSVVTND